MNSKPLIILLGALALSGCESSDAPVVDETSGNDRPNILLIVADDMGFTDLGSFGGEIRTPVLDELAYNGVRLSNYHVHPSCAPTRAALLSGALPHQAGIGTQLVTIERFADDPLVNMRRGKPGYEGYLNEGVVTIPTLLQDAGYRTYMTGKWHVGNTQELSAAARGFDRSFELIFGSGNHFPGTPGQVYREDGVPVEVPDDFYSTEFFTDRAIAYIDESRDSGEPWFTYLAYTSPHWPLQVPDEWLDKYVGAYDAGFDELRTARIEGALERGVISSAAAANPAAEFAAPWTSLDEPGQRKYRRAMEIYASMVENMDFHVGRMLAYLEESSQLENTVIVFMSDNGAESFDFDWMENRAPRRPAAFDNSVENFGREDSFIVYGPGWAQAGMGPYHLHKGTTASGGIRASAFVNFSSVADKGGVDNTFLTVRDLSATILNIAGAKHPGDQYKGRDVVALEGDSFWPLLTGEIESMDRPDKIFLWEHDGQVGLVRNGWKYSRPGAAHGTEAESTAWQLFNLAIDPGETTDVSADNLELLAEFAAEWQRAIDSDGIIPYPD